jgi:hypothetical protein
MHKLKVILLMRHQALPTNWSGADDGRATKGAALALLAKTYLFEKKWEQAVSTAQGVEALGVYSLTNLFTDNFNANKKDNTEAIFSVWHKSGSNPFLGNNFKSMVCATQFKWIWIFLSDAKPLSIISKKSPNGVDDPRLGYTMAGDGIPIMIQPTRIHGQQQVIFQRNKFSLVRNSYIHKR